MQFGQKGLDELCKKLQKALKDAKLTLEVLQPKSVGPKDLNSKEAQVKFKAKIKMTKDLMVQTLKQWYNEAIASTYVLLCNLLASTPQTQ